jgi:hypothetical protein
VLGGEIKYSMRAEIGGFLYRKPPHGRTITFSLPHVAMTSQCVTAERHQVTKILKMVLSGRRASSRSVARISGGVGSMRSTYMKSIVLSSSSKLFGGLLLKR